MDSFIRTLQFLFEPNDFTKPIIILLSIIGVFLFGLFTVITKKRKLKIAEQQKTVQLSKDLKDSKDLTDLLVVLALLGIGKK